MRSFSLPHLHAHSKIRKIVSQRRAEVEKLVKETKSNSSNTASPFKPTHDSSAEAKKHRQRQQSPIAKIQRHKSGSNEQTTDNATKVLQKRMTTENKSEARVPLPSAAPRSLRCEAMHRRTTTIMEITGHSDVFAVCHSLSHLLPPILLQ